MISTDDNRDGITMSGASDTLPKHMLDDAPQIARLRARFDEAREDPNSNRVKSEEARDYFDGPGQIDKIRAVLRERKQPEIYTNRVRPAVNGVLGVLEAARSDPRAYPRNPDDEDQADVATKMLRFIADECTFSDTKIDVAENFLIEGTGAVLIEMDGDRVVATQIRWEEFYFDPYSRRSDFSDARYMGVGKWIDAETLRSRYKVRIDEIGDPLGAMSGGDASWADRPANGPTPWIDRNRKRVMLVEEYHRAADGKWMRCVYIANGVLEYDVSPWLDEKKRPCCPIEAVSCYVDRKNGRYGIVEDMKPLADEINSSRSRSQHLMNSRQVQNVDPSAPPVDDAIVRIEAAKADGVIPQGWQVLSSAEMTMANLNRMQEAKSEIERMGPTPAVLGRQEGGNQSGRARLVSQQAGLTELARPLARLAAWELRCFRQIFNRARQFFTDAMWIRVTDDLKAPTYLQVNEPVMGMVPQPLVDPSTGQPVVDPMTGQPAVQMAQGVVEVKNRVAEMDMDIILDTVPDTANLAQETFADLKELVAGGLDPFSPAFELMIEMSPLADKARIVEKLKGKREEMQQAQQAQAQAQAEQEAKAREIGEATAAAELENIKAKTALVTAQALDKSADRHGKEMAQEKEASGENEDREDAIAERGQSD